MGVTFFRLDALKARNKLSQPVVWSSTGTAQLSAVGGGGERRIAAQRATATVNEHARFQVDGSEQSECDSGYEVTRSSAVASAGLAPADAKTLEFNADIRARGGHYATAAGCAAGRPVGVTGHDNSTTIDAIATGTTRCTLRADQPRWLVLQGNALPSESTVSVQAPDGGTLTAEGRSPGATPVRDKEALRYRLTGAGVYVVNVVINVQVVGHGAQTATYQRTGTLKASTEAMTPGS